MNEKKFYEVLMHNVSSLKLLALLATVVLLSGGCESRVANHLPGSNPWLDGNIAQGGDFTLHADEGPVVMLNLLKFHPVTKDGTMSGAESYAKYGELAGPLVAKYQGTLIWSGVPTQQLIGDMDYDWDLVLIVSWPKRQNLLDLAADPDYKKISHYRGDGLARSMLIAMDEVLTLGRSTEGSLDSQ